MCSATMLAAREDDTEKKLDAQLERMPEEGEEFSESYTPATIFRIYRPCVVVEIKGKMKKKLRTFTSAHSFRDVTNNKSILYRQKQE